MPSHRHKSRRRRTFFGRLLHKVKKSYYSLRKREKEREYRPFRPKQQSDVIIDNRDKTNGEVHKSRSKHRKKIPGKGGFFYELKRRWKENQRRRRKKRHKKRIERKHRREFKKQQRIQFIRQFIPTYKGGGKTSFGETLTSEEKEKKFKKGFYYYTVNSTALYVISYILVYMIYQLTVLIVASRWGLDSVLYYYDLAFNDYSPLWSRYNIIVVTFSGPFISLIIGFIFYKWIANKHKIKGFMKLFILWIGFHGFNLFLGAFVSGVSFDEGFGYVANWLYFNVFWKFLISLIFLSILALTGYYSTKKWLETSNSTIRVNKRNRTRFLFHQVVLPWFLGSLLVFIVKIPNNTPYETGTLVTMMFAVVPVLLNIKAEARRGMIGKRKPVRIKWSYIILLLLILTLYRVGLDTGYHVVLKYKISLSVTPV